MERSFQTFLKQHCRSESEAEERSGDPEEGL